MRVIHSVACGRRRIRTHLPETGEERNHSTANPPGRRDRRPVRAHTRVADDPSSCSTWSGREYGSMPPVGRYRGVAAAGDPERSGRSGRNIPTLSSARSPPAPALTADPRASTVPSMNPLMRPWILETKSGTGSGRALGGPACSTASLSADPDASRRRVRRARPRAVRFGSLSIRIRPRTGDLPKPERRRSRVVLICRPSFRRVYGWAGAAPVRPWGPSSRIDIVTSGARNARMPRGHQVREVAHGCAQ